MRSAQTLLLNGRSQAVVPPGQATHLPVSQISPAPHGPSASHAPVTHLMATTAAVRNASVRVGADVVGNVAVWLAGVDAHALAATAREVAARRSLARVPAVAAVEMVGLEVYAPLLLQATPAPVLAEGFAGWARVVLTSQHDGGGQVRLGQRVQLRAAHGSGGPWEPRLKRPCRLDSMVVVSTR